MVLKEAGKDGKSDSDFFQESDLKDGVNGKKNNEKKEESDKLLAIALGVIFSIIGIILLAMISYHMWKKRQVKAINENLKVASDEPDEKNQVKIAPAI